MVDRGRRRLIPPELLRGRALVIIILAAVVAVVLIAVALALATAPSPDGGEGDVPEGVYTPPPTVTPDGSAPEVRVDSFSFDQNTSGGTTFFVTVTNTGNETMERDLNVAVGQASDLAPPNQPYPSQERPAYDPVPVNSERITLAPGESRTVPVTVNTPPGFAVDPDNVVITVT